MIRRQPITKAGRQQQLLLTATRQKVLGHAGIVINPPDISTGQAGGLRDSL